MFGWSSSKHSVSEEDVGAGVLSKEWIQMQIMYSHKETVTWTALCLLLSWNTSIFLSPNLASHSASSNSTGPYSSTRELGMIKCMLWSTECKGMPGQNPGHWGLKSRSLVEALQMCSFKLSCSPLVLKDRNNYSVVLHGPPESMPSSHAGYEILGTVVSEVIFPISDYSVFLGSK